MNAYKGNHWPFQKVAQVHGRRHFYTCRDPPVGDSPCWGLRREENMSLPEMSSLWRSWALSWSPRRHGRGIGSCGFLSAKAVQPETLGVWEGLVAESDRREGGKGMDWDRQKDR